MRGRGAAQLSTHTGYKRLKIPSWKEDHLSRLWSRVYTYAVGLHFTSDDRIEVWGKISESIKGRNPESRVDDIFLRLTLSTP